MRVGIVAAEPSGDMLAAGLMQAMRQMDGTTHFEGIGGEAMQALGMEAWFPMEKLSHMGLAEVLAHIPELLVIRSELIRRWRTNPPDLFIGVDAPDFNLRLEQVLKQLGVPTVHFVSPTVWAWRRKRVKKIRKAVDLLLCIFPFEADYLRSEGVDARYVGHPLASEYPLQVDRQAARAALDIEPNSRVLALLPGSRMGEVGRLARPFLHTAQACAQQMDEMVVVTPTATEATRRKFERLLAQYAPDLPVRIRAGDTALALTAADAALVASGTATFEALLCKTPMVVGYKLNALTYRLINGLKMLKVEQVAMANLLSDEVLAPEFIQQRCEPRFLLPALLRLFNDESLVRQIQEHYMDTHRQLIMDTHRLAANAVFTLIEERST